MRYVSGDITAFLHKRLSITEHNG